MIFLDTSRSLVLISPEVSHRQVAISVLDANHQVVENLRDEFGIGILVLHQPDRQSYDLAFTHPL